MSNHSSQYTHGYHRSVLRSHNNRTVDNSAQYFADALTPGLALLDVGSGAGTITADFARRLNPGRVTALEMTDEAIELTRSEVQRQNLDNVDFAVGDVHDLSFPDHHFDIVHAHQVLQHVRDPVRALTEMKRVCRPGGLVVARDADYAGFVWHPEMPELDQWMNYYQKVSRTNGGEPNAGRFLLQWAQQAGFSNIQSTSSTWCLSTPQARQWWGTMWADRILESKIADQLQQLEIATHSDLQNISQAWKRWADTEYGWMSLLHGEIICRV